MLALPAAMVSYTGTNWHALESANSQWEPAVSDEDQKQLGCIYHQMHSLI